MRKAVVSKLTSKGQVTVPEEIRGELHLVAGDRLVWEISEKGVARVQRLGGDWRDLAGLLSKPGVHQSLEAMDDGIRRHLARKHRVRR